MPKDKDKEKEVDMAKIAEILENLPGGMQSAVAKAIRDENERIMAARAADNDDDEDEEDFEEEDDDVDLDDLSRDQFAQYLMKQFTKAQKASLKPLVDRIEGLASESESDKWRREIATARSNYKDFTEWGEEIKAVLTKNPDISVDDAYHLAKARNPEKVKEISEKFETAEKEEEDKKNPKSLFGGLTPTSRVGGSSEETPPLNQKEASEKAWEDAMAGLPKELIGQAS